jgi:hypothetical protein
VLEPWADADYEDELVAPLYLHCVTFDDALRLWKLARDRNMSGRFQSGVKLSVNSL